MIVPSYITVNGGIPTLSSNSISVSTSAVSFDFTPHRNVGRPYRGLVIVRINQAIPAGTTDTLPIQFTSGGTNAKTVDGYNGDSVTVAEFPGTGVYLLWYESQTDTLQLLSSF